MTDTNDALPIEGLNKKVDAVIDHCATNFGVSAEKIGKLEARTESTSNVLELLSTDFLESHDGLGAQFKSLEALVNQINERPSNNRASIYAALAKAQQEIVNADANIDNAFLKTKYADLGSCLNAVRGPLSSNGIALIQLTEDQSQSVLGIRTILAHESGETIEDLITMSPPKMDPQGIGSCRTYMRRYSLMAICGIAGSLDDDAEGTKKDPNDYAKITAAEAEKIIYTADELFGDRSDAAVKKMLYSVFGGINTVSQIKEGEHEAAITALTNAKGLMDKKDAAVAKAEKAAAKAAKAEK